MARRFTDAQIEYALHQCGGLHSRTARALTSASKTGHAITRQGVAKRIAQSPRLQAALYDIAEEIKDIAEDRLIRNIKAGKEKTVNWYLATKAPERGYAQRLSLNAGVDEDGNPIPLSAAPTVVIYIPDNGRDPAFVTASPARISNSNGSHAANGPSPDGADTELDPVS